jgi:hypothetical protein
VNIFILDTVPELCAQYHCDKHVVKMILESAQLLSTAAQQESKIDGLYKPTHFNHPCSIWTRTSRSNFLWLVELAKQLCIEYTHRYEKNHKSFDVILKCYDLQDKINDGELTPFVQAMPEKYRSDNAVDSYRNYYVEEKYKILSYTRRDRPYWIFNL